MEQKLSAWDTVWITGASSGLGLELAKQLNDRVGHLAVSARSADMLSDIAGALANANSYPLDVSDAKAVKKCVSGIEAAAGPIDLAILNAGVWQIMDAETLDVDAVRRGIDVNYMGVVHAISAVLPGMLERGRGHIAIIASVSGYRGLPRAAAYGPTKAALINLAETLHAELAPRGIVVSIVNPGFVDTPMTRGNPFPMPGLMPVEIAAARLLSGLERQKYEVVFPRRLVYVMKLLRLLPNALFFWVIRTFVMSKKS